MKRLFCKNNKYYLILEKYISILVRFNLFFTVLIPFCMDFISF